MQIIEVTETDILDLEILMLLGDEGKDIQSPADISFKTRWWRRRVCCLAS